MVINLWSLPQKTIDKYDLIELSQNGEVYIEIQKGMYRLQQADILAVNTTGKAGAQIFHLPLGDDSSPWGR
jgi:hypothetical protein